MDNKDNLKLEIIDYTVEPNSTENKDKAYTKIELEPKRHQIVGIAKVMDNCFICEKENGYLRELPEFDRAVYYLCSDCLWQNENARIATSALHGWFYMHSWEGLIVNIERSSGKVHQARVCYLFDNLYEPHFQCCWYSNKGEEKPSRENYYSPFVHTSRAITYKSLKKLNPGLPELYSCKVFRGIPIADNFIKTVDNLINRMKAD